MNFSGEARLVNGEGVDSDAEFIVRARRGDDYAWLTLVRRYQEPVFRLAYLILRDADEAEDVAQEAFVRAYKSMDRFDDSRPFRPWLLAIAANLARNRRRSAGRYLAAARRFFEKVQEPAGAGPTTPDRLQRRWQSETLAQAVERLNDTAREIIYLRYFMELSEAETAAILNVPAGTVKSRSHRALERLRAVIEQEYPALREAFAESGD